MMNRSLYTCLRFGGVPLGISLLAGIGTAAPSAEREIIGQSPSGEPIAVWTLAERGSGTSPGDQPAIAVIAGVQGHHQIGVRVAEEMGQLLLERHPDAFQGRTVYIIPRVNPEGIARFASNRVPRALSGRAPEPRDADRDRRVDEDPPNDLNNDGMITMMRVPAPVTAFDLMPTHVIDTDDPRIVRKPNDDERATHAVLIEGVDDDGDGRFNEDGWGGASGGGVDIDMHFPTHWPEHTDGAGLFPLHRPEARAVVDWLQSRGNVAAVIVFGPHDTIVSVPPTGRFGVAGRVPTGIESDDEAAYKLASDAFKEITGITQTESGPHRAGSLVQWAYADLGVYAFSTPVWVRPDLVKLEETGEDASSGEDSESVLHADSADARPTQEEIDAADRADLVERGVGQMFIDLLFMNAQEQAAVMSELESMNPAEMQQIITDYTALPVDVQARINAIRNGGEDPGPSEELLASVSAGGSSGPDPTANPKKKRDDSPTAKWLAWIDERMPSGFIDWQPFDHPQLGQIEIGGFAPGIRVNPPEEHAERLAEQQAAFAAALLDMLPDLTFDQPTVERVGNGVWRIGITLRNDGMLPTKSAIGLKTRRLPGIVCVIDPDQRLATDQIVSGSRAIRFASVEGRGTTERAEWLVVAERGHAVTLEIRTPLTGTTRYELTMENN